MVLTLLVDVAPAEITLMELILFWVLVLVDQLAVAPLVDVDLLLTPLEIAVPLTLLTCATPAIVLTPAPVIANHVDLVVTLKLDVDQLPPGTSTSLPPTLPLTVPPAPLIKSLLPSLILSLTPFTPFLTLPLTTHRLPSVK